MRKFIYTLPFTPRGAAADHFDYLCDSEPDDPSGEIEAAAPAEGAVVAEPGEEASRTRSLVDARQPLVRFRTGILDAAESDYGMLAGQP